MKQVVLRQSRDEDGSRYLAATLDGAGDLRIEGQDLGDGVERIFGMREYEWVWTVRAADLPALRAALDGRADLLAALQHRFSGEQAAGLKAFLDENEVPHESWSRVGD